MLGVELRALQMLHNYPVTELHKPGPDNMFFFLFIIFSLIFMNFIHCFVMIFTTLPQLHPDTLLILYQHKWTIYFNDNFSTKGVVILFAVKTTGNPSIPCGYT